MAQSVFRQACAFGWPAGERPSNFGKVEIMEQDRRDVFKTIGTLGASALALMGVSKPAKADEAAASNPLVGLWDMTIPIQVGLPTPLYYKYAISEGAYVATGSLIPSFFAVC